MASIEYDPNRTTRIALLHYVDGEKRYILAPQDLRWGTRWSPAPRRTSSRGIQLPLSNIPNGTLVHNVEMKPGKGGQMARAAGSAAQLMAKEGKQAHLKLPSARCGWCRWSAGPPSAVEQRGAGKRLPGQSRAETLGRQAAPCPGRGHEPGGPPMGGGEGKSSGGRHPCTPWGVPTKGYKTRKPKASDR